VIFRRLTYGLSAIFALLGPVLFLRDIRLSEWAMLPVELGFALWLSSPFALVVLAVRDGRLPAVGALVSTLLAGLFGAWFQLELTFHFTTKSDAQDGIAMLFVTAYQHAIVILTLGLSFFVGRLKDLRK
jgi:hypothetical protein